jgi:hypothetical protein
MNSRNERAPGERGAGELRLSHLGCGADSITPRQGELFGALVAVDEHTTYCEACPQCGATIAIDAPGRGPHFASLRCLRGHFLRWLSKPRGAR